jgi:hypothetical protein
VSSRGSSNFEEQHASWGEGEREDGKEERVGGGEGYWEGGCGQGRGGREEVGGGGWLRRKDGGDGCEDVRSQEQAVGLLEEEEPRCEHG